MDKRTEEIKLAIAAAERKAKDLRDALRQLERICGKARLTEKDVQVHEQACQTLRRHDLVVPEAFRHICW